MTKIRWWVMLLALCAGGLAARGADGPGKLELPQRWFYLPTNMLKITKVD